MFVFYNFNLAMIKNWDISPKNWISGLPWEKITTWQPHFFANSKKSVEIGKTCFFRWGHAINTVFSLLFLGFVVLLTS